MLFIHFLALPWPKPPTHPSRGGLPPRSITTRFCYLSNDVCACPALYAGKRGSDKNSRVGAYPAIYAGKRGSLKAAGWACFWFYFSNIFAPSII
jgi:hypothetical protein